MTPSEGPRAPRASGRNELLDYMRASCWISAQYWPGKLAIQQFGTASAELSGAKTLLVSLIEGCPRCGLYKSMNRIVSQQTLVWRAKSMAATAATLGQSTQENCEHDGVFWGKSQSWKR